MPQQKQPLPRSAPSQNLRWQKPNPVHHANLAIQMLAAALNHRAPKYVEQSAVMMFGILPENHSARVAKSQVDHVAVMKMNVQLAHLASTTTKHHRVHHVLAVMTQHRLAHHAHTEMKRQVVPVVMTQRHIAPEVTCHRFAHHELVAMKYQLAHRASTTTMLQFVHRALSAKKFMHRSLVCCAKKFQLNA
jgi:hypothetical protein